MVGNRVWLHLRALSEDLIALDKEIVETGAADMGKLDSIMFDAYRLMSVQIPKHLEYIGTQRKSHEANKKQPEQKGYRNGRKRRS